LELCQASLDKVFLSKEDSKKYCGPLPSAKNLLYQLAIGLEHIHEKELIHRDLKPENVLIWVSPENGQVLMKWADFGLSKSVNERGTYSMSGIKGTMEWLAPELLRLLDDARENEQSESEVRQRGTVKSDVFAEGLTFGYYLLGGLHLFGSRFHINSNIFSNKPVNLKGKSDHSR
jgi:serine/threonine-protein kinase/endoribonuclease IRE1